ncbi:AAA family ATPase [Acidiphilium acidophilum]|uniref:AAA family ATPase n=1 Tax=Acidiphilium acidophilum TaxID=76588 RepID=UPI002E8E7352|nr:AAA family ATPase [Acidiphilium acidophilum]
MGHDKEVLQDLARRKELAREGKYIPTLQDLLLGCPWYRDSQEADLAAYCDRLISRHMHFFEQLSKPLCSALEKIKADDEFILSEYVRVVINVLDEKGGEIATRRGGISLAEIALRLKLHLLYDGNNSYRADIVERLAGGWFRDLEELRPIYFFHMLGIMMNQPRFPRLLSPAKSIEFGGELHDTAARLDQLHHGKNTGGLDIGKLEPVTEEMFKLDGLIILKSLGGSTAIKSSEIVKDFEPLVNKPVKTILKPDNITMISDKLNLEFPHAIKITSAVLSAVKNSGDVLYIAPTILVGAAGSGKSEYAKRLFSLLGIPHAYYSCAGVRDSTFGGTSRQWSTSQPSFPVETIRQHLVANPGIILDEIEKSDSSAFNGRLTDTLLVFLERSTSRKYTDACLMSEIDLSHVLYIATANSLDGISIPLRDRCRILDFPTPSPDHTAVLAANIIAKIRLERDIGSIWLPDLDAVEIEAISEIWRGGSLRSLRRLVEGVLDARDAAEISMMN